ncbi:hypothetical protein AB4254_12125 [Vibrio breoganii]
MKQELSRTYTIFSTGWDSDFCKNVSQEAWVNSWADFLHRFDKDCIHSVTNYIITNFYRPPTLGEFYKLCERQLSGELLDTPISTKAEELAKIIINNIGHVDMDSDVTPDALMIAACVIKAKQVDHASLPLSDSIIEIDFAGRMRMFAQEAKIWLDESKQGKGFWKKELSNK